MSRLDEIVAEKRREVSTLRQSTSEETLRATAAQMPPTRGFRRMVKAGRPSLIAEVKYASPSRGTLADDFDPAAIAAEYARGGADAISILTDQHFFKGSPAHLTTVRAAVSVPVLRKDFVIDPIQVMEARVIGADAVLLIVRLLDDRSLRAWRELAESLGMDALVEVHDATEVRRAVDSGAAIVGVNNRDLTTFEVHLATSERLRPLIPSGVLAVSESGVLSPEDADRMFRAGYDAILVGEGVMRARDRAQAVRNLKGHASAGPLR